MKKIKKLGAILGAALLMLGACGTGGGQSDKVQVVTTSYALRYFIEQLGGDDVEVVFSLTGNPHHFELSQKDARNIADADLFVNVEAGDYIAIGEQIQNVNKNMTVANVAENIPLIEYSADHIHEHEGEEGHDHEDGEEGENHEEGADHDHDDAHNLDPHVWLDPIRTKTVVENIANALVTIEGVDQDKVKANAQKLQTKLDALNQSFEAKLDASHGAPIVVSHAAYGYLVDRYHLSQKGINTGSDHSENTQTSMMELDDFIAANEVKYIYVEPNMGTNNSVDVLVSKHKLEVKELYNLETAVEKSADYFELMEENATNLSLSKGHE